MTHQHDADQSTAWATVIVILLVVIAILLVGYFAWWAPARRDIVVTPAERQPNIIEPAPEQPAEPAQPSQPVQEEPATSQ